MTKMITPAELAEIITTLLTDPSRTNELTVDGTYGDLITAFGHVVCDFCGGEVHYHARRDLVDDSNDWMLGIEPNDEIPANGGVWAKIDPDNTRTPGHMISTASNAIEDNASLAQQRGSNKFNPYDKGTHQHNAYEKGWNRDMKNQPLSMDALITNLRTEAETFHDHPDTRAAIETAAAWLERAAKALGPFAVHNAGIVQTLPDDTFVLDVEGGGPSLTLGEFKAAANALTKSVPGEYREVIRCSSDLDALIRRMNNIANMYAGRGRPGNGIEAAAARIEQTVAALRPFAITNEWLDAHDPIADDILLINAITRGDFKAVYQAANAAIPVPVTTQPAADVQSVISLLKTETKHLMDRPDISTAVEAASAWLMQANAAIIPFAAINEVLTLSLPKTPSLPDDTLVYEIREINDYMTRGQFKAAKNAMTGTAPPERCMGMRPYLDTAPPISDVNRLIVHIDLIADFLAARSEPRYGAAAAVTRMGQLADALYPFAQAGRALSSLPRPDNTPVLAVRIGPIPNSLPISIEHFKAAVQAVDATTPVLPPPDDKAKSRRGLRF